MSAALLAWTMTAPTAGVSAEGSSSPARTSASIAAPAPVVTLEPPAAEGGATFVDESACGRCHEAEYHAWHGSQHDLAMQAASAQTVLGDFDDARFTYGSVTSRFFRRGGKFVVRTDGPDGALADFEVKYAFGLEPLQQYLVELPGGRLQALPIAWDTKQQRWFHLYPDEHVDHRDELHWTRRLQNWNHMCGECHTTGYRKRYDEATRSYHTTAARLDVGCQACHGPASRHLERLKRSASGAVSSPASPSSAGSGATPASPPDGTPDPKSASTTTAGQDASHDFDVDLSAADSAPQIETCALCHSRRSGVWADYRYGKPLMDTHLPALLTEGLYYADGQIEDEVYVYGSFLQSKMYAKGVRCSDCHQPHSTKVRAKGDALCISCHNPFAPAARSHVDTRGFVRKDYASPDHHHHEPGKPGSHCVDCHAPARTYMVVDPRRDHSFRIPRPDVSVAISTPNACNGCHKDQSAQWAADAVARWYGPTRRHEPHYGLALDAGRFGKPGAMKQLVTLAGDAATPAIVRATALDLLPSYPGASALQALRRGLDDPSPLVRRAAVSGFDLLAPADRIAAVALLLSDPVRGVRIEAARLLAPVISSLPADEQARAERVLAEYETGQRENADQPEALTNLGNLYRERGDPVRAESAYLEAIAVDASFVPAHVNLADLYRTLGRDGDAERVLRDGLEAVPKSPDLHGALGLTLVRERRKQEALAELEAAANEAPGISRHAYVYALALQDAGRSNEAIAVLKDAASRRGDRDVLLALAAFERASGDTDGAADQLRKLRAINPDDPALAVPGHGH